MNIPAEFAKVIKHLDTCEKEVQQARMILRRCMCATGRSDGSFERMIQTVSAVMGVPVALILGNERSKAIVTARHAVFWIGHKIWCVPSAEVGRFFGCDHGTVLNGCTNITNRRSIDQQFKALTDALVERVRDFEPNRIANLVGKLEKF